MSFPAGRTDRVADRVGDRVAAFSIDAVTDAERASAGRAIDHVLAVAIEPSRLAAGLVDAKGELLLRDRVTTPTRDVWRTLEQLIRRIIAAAPPGLPRPRAVGVSCIGPVDTRAGTVSPPLVPAWTNFPLREHLERLTGLEVELDSAGGAATEAERWIGEARGASSYLSVRIDTTVESGCVIDGVRLSGAHGNAALIAHINVEPGGKRCRCGALGCLEAYVSSTALQAEFNRPLGRATTPMAERTGIMLARAVASMCATLDVSTVFLSGNVIDALGDPMLDALHRELAVRSRLKSLNGLQIIEPHERIWPLVAAASLALH
ncbi:MAG: ROK family protein [Ilumatobacter sp.]|uniref:ROK family protein n=1 Tax=uncultured Ilumatobacter sp. TaxID=879968 RepID=UPI0035903C52|tara:strand:+ start:463 stop:1422 length:960 start_codon:yes stop_codon:yes gene_type:complete